MSIHCKTLVGAVAGALFCAAAGPALADHPAGGSLRFGTFLDGYQEVPMTLNSPGSGEFVARVRQDGSAIDYQLTYRNLPGVIQAHVHMGRPALNGGIVLWLCNQSATPPDTIPVPKTCQEDAAATGTTVTGTLTAADVVASPNNLIPAGAEGFAAVIDAFRAGAVYANVHTDARPGGEIRGNIGGTRRVDDDHHH